MIPRLRRLGRRGGRVVAVAGVVLLLLELSLRGYFWVNNRFGSPTRVLTEKLGWRTQPDVSWRRSFRGYGTVSLSTTRHGFRVFGDVDSVKQKWLVVGDSYTEAGCVSDGNTYYDHLRRERPDVEVFAYGCAGYGSLQEYLIVDSYADQIKPDRLIWQFCGNDLSDNSLEFEAAHSRADNYMRRPYLEQGQIVWRFPKRSTCGAVILRWCHLARFASAYAGAQSRLAGVRTAPPPQDGLFLKACQATESVMALVRKRLGVPILAFCAECSPQVDECYRRVCAQQGIDYIPGLSAAIDAAAERGAIVDGAPYDSHWNAVGHRLAGELILARLREEESLSERGQHSAEGRPGPVAESGR